MIDWGGLYNSVNGSRSEFFQRARDLGATTNEISRNWSTLEAIRRDGGRSISSTSNSGSILSGLFDDRTGDNIFKKLFNIGNNAVKAVIGGFGDVYSTQIGQKTNVDEDIDIFKKLIDAGKNGGIGLGTIGGLAVEVRDTLLTQLEQESKLRYDINSQTSLTGKLSEIVRKELIESSIASAEFGYNLEDVADLYKGLVQQSGKFSLINKEIVADASPLASTLAMSMSEFSTLLGDFEKVGVGTSDTMKAINKIVIDSIGLGLSSKKITTEIQQNIDKLNQYGFKNGVDGLSKMVQKSNEFKMSMQSVYGIAEKVFSPEGAIELAANLQVLGGAIGDFNDPLRLMYMANNDIGGIQDALIGAASSLATYNEEQGRFEVTGINLRRAREMAQGFGIDMGELSKIAVSTAERTQAATMLMSTGLDLKSEQMEFLTNLSRMDGGELKIMIPEDIATKLGSETKISLDNLSQKQANYLFSMQNEFKDLSIKDIAKNQLTETQQMARDMAVVGSYYRVVGAKMLKGAAKGAGGDTLIDDLRYNINEYKENVLKKTTGNIENDTMKWTKGKIEKIKSEPIETLKDAATEVWNEILKILKEKGVDLGQNNRVSKVIHEHRSSGTLLDNYTRELMMKGSKDEIYNPLSFT